MYEDVQNYLQHQVLSASPAQLIDMLYDRACRDLNSAKEFFTDPNDRNAICEAVKFVVHAQRIITELKRCLNLEQGGELADNLDRLYEYMQFRLTESVQQLDARGVGEVAELLNELYQAWHSSVLDPGPDAVGDPQGASTSFLVA